MSAGTRDKTIKKPEVIALCVVSLLIHGGLIWWLMASPKVTPAKVPPMTAAAPQSVQVDLTQPPPPQPQTQPTPPVDENSVKPPPKKEVKKPQPKPKPKPKPKPVPKPKPTPKPKPASKPAPKPAPKPSPKPAPNPSPSPSTSNSNNTNQASKSASGNSDKVTPAVSGMAALGNPPPQYPGLALRRRIEGNVSLKILVTPQGRAGQVQVTSSSGSSILDKAAVQTVKGWKFRPAKRGNTPIAGWALQTVSFKLPPQ